MSALKRNAPSPSVVKVLDSPVALFFAMTVAFGTAAPAGSVTVPRIVPAPNWAHSSAADKKNPAKASQRFDPNIILLAILEQKDYYKRSRITRGVELAMRRAQA